MARRLPSGLALALLVIHGCASHRTSQPGAEPAAPPVAARVAKLEVPPGHYPPAGSCRVWFPGQPPGRQPKPTTCSAAEKSAQSGSWIIFRPGSDRKVIHVREVDSRRAGVVVRVRIHDATSGAYLRDTRP